MTRTETILLALALVVAVFVAGRGSARDEVGVCPGVGQSQGTVSGRAGIGSGRHDVGPAETCDQPRRRALTTPAADKPDIAEAPSDRAAAASPSSSAADSEGSPSPATPKPTQQGDGGAVAGGTAAYCAPTPRYCRGWGGRVLLGAVHSFRWGDRPYYAKVCRQDRPTVCTTVRIVSFCACGRHIVDLSPYAFEQLAPLWRGSVPVFLRLP